MRISDWSSDVCSSDLIKQDVATGHGGGDGIGACLDTVRHNAMGCAMQFIHALNAQGGGANAFDLCVHRHKTIVQIGDFRRAEERRVGKECDSTCRFRWSPNPYKKTSKQKNTCK